MKKNNNNNSNINKDFIPYGVLFWDSRHVCSTTSPFGENS